jgi:hypothetical protein
MRTLKIHTNCLLCVAVVALAGCATESPKPSLSHDSVLEQPQKNASDDQNISAERFATEVNLLGTLIAALLNK